MARRVVLPAFILCIGLMAGSRLAPSPVAANRPPLVMGGAEWPQDPGPFTVPIDNADLGLSLIDGGSRAAEAQNRTAASGAVLASDNFSSPAAGILPAMSSHPDVWKLRYLNGEYQVASVAPGLDLGESVVLPGTFNDVSISASIRLAYAPGLASDETARLYCRRQTSGNGFTGYRLQYSPQLNQYALFRGDGAGGYSLTGVQPVSGAQDAWGMHKLVLTCSGNTISVSIDGKMVTRVQDASYASGEVAIGAGNFSRQNALGIDATGFFGAGAAYSGILRPSLDESRSNLALASGEAGPRVGSQAERLDGSGQRPRKSGGRFSAKARGPSLASSVSRSTAMIAASSLSPSLMCRY